MNYLLTNWVFLAWFSSIATAVLIVISSIVLGGIHSSAIMLVRVFGVFCLVMPAFIRSYNEGKIGGQDFEIDGKYIIQLTMVGIFAGLSWYSFYLALDYGKKSEISDATITAINYSSVGFVLLINWFLGRHDPSWQNVMGVVLIALGVYLTSKK